MVNVTCPNCGTTVDLDAGRGFGFCVNCGTRLTVDGASAQTSGTTPGYRILVRVTIVLPPSPAPISGSFSYFGIKWDGNDSYSKKTSEVQVIDTTAGRHDLEVRQMNNGFFSAKVTTVSGSFDVSADTVINVFVEGDHLVLSGPQASFGTTGSSGLSIN